MDTIATVKTIATKHELADADGAERAAPLRADWSRLPRSIELDEPWVGGGTYWERMERQHNIDPALKEMLHDAYGHR